MIQTTITTICDRCGREAPERAKGAPPALAVEALAESISYPDLCERCAGVCRDYLRKIGGLPTLRKRAREDLAEAPADE